MDFDTFAYILLSDNRGLWEAQGDTISALTKYSDAPWLILVADTSIQDFARSDMAKTTKEI